MDDLIDFEALIDINEVIGSMEKEEREIQNVSQDTRIEALDNMCEAEDENNTSTENADKEQTVGEDTDSDEIINLDDFEDIFSEMYMSVGILEKLEHREFSISDLIDIEASKDEINDPVDEHNISAEVTQTTDLMDDGMIPTIVNLDEFEMIFREIRVSNDTEEMIKKEENKEIILNDTNIEPNENSVTSHTEIDFDKIANTDNNHKIYDDEYKTVIEDLKGNDECQLSTELLEVKVENTLKLNNLEENYSIIDKELDQLHAFINSDDIADEKDETKDDILKDNDAEYELSEPKLRDTTQLNNIEENDDIIDLDAIESDTDLDPLEQDAVITKDNSKTVQESKETDIISLSSTDSDDDGYNSSDFEFITEGDAKKNNLTKTNIQSYTYFNADYKKYHKSRYLPCQIISARAKRESHVIPQGESYYDLFRGMYAPAVMNTLCYAGNKRVLPVTSMTLQDGYGFDLFENRCEENDEDKSDANESLKKIRFLYPDENRKRRRRF